GLVARTASSDLTAPVATITTTSGQTVAGGSSFTINGTASDVAGLVAGIEVSTDGGVTWHPATLLTPTTWTYSFVPNTLASLSILARATDDSANRGASSSPITLNMQANSTVSIFSPLIEPLRVDAQDPSSIEV